MNRKARLVVPGIILAIGLLLVVVLIMRAGSPRGWIDDRYRRVSYNSATDAAVYTSPEKPSRVLRDITSRWDPYQRLNDPVGYFLRYSDLIVLVRAGDRGGSRIRVEDEGRGYHLWGAYIGGAWGSYRGRGEGFRGGGPGAGK